MNYLKVYLVAGYQDAGERFLPILEEALSAGITCFQFRDKGVGSLMNNPTAQEALGRSARALCHQYGVPFIVNDDVHLALKLNADGLHLGQKDASLKKIGHFIPADWLIGLSVNRLEEALRDENNPNIDYFGVGPIYPTLSKTDHEPAVGLKFIQTLRQNGIKKPLVAIGGIKTSDVALLRAFGANGVAVISAITQAENISLAVKGFLNG